MEHHCQ